MATTKNDLRTRMKRCRAELTDGEARASRAFAHLDATRAYREARTVMWYVSFGDELPTVAAIAQCARSKVVVIPYCYPDRIGLWRFESFEELAPSQFGVLEPPPHRREDPERSVVPTCIDLVVVPGLAFDRAGGRLGFGKGYYDGFLRGLAPSAIWVGFAFAEQLVDQVPTEPHDVPMHAVVTDRGIVSCPGGKSLTSEDRVQA